MRVTMAAWAFGLCFGAVVAVRIAHETHLQAFYLKGLGMDPKTVGSMWTLYFFWVGACEPIMGVVIDALRDRGVYPSTIIIVLTPIWTYQFLALFTPSSPDPWRLLAVLLPFGWMQATMLMLTTTLFQSSFPAGVARQAASTPRQLLAIIGLLVGMVSPPLLSSDWTTTHAMARTLAVGAGSGLMLGALLLRSLQSTLDALEPEAAPAAQRKPQGPAAVAPKVGHVQRLLEIVGVFSHPTFRYMLLMSAISQHGNALFSTSLQAFLHNVAKVRSPTPPFLCSGGAIAGFLKSIPHFQGWDMTHQGCLVSPISVKWQKGLVPISFYLANLAMAPLVSRLSKQWGAQRTLATEYRVYACILFLSPLMVMLVEGSSYSTEITSLLVMIATAILLGCAAAGLSLLPDVVISKYVDEDAIEKKRSRAGAFFGARQVANRAGSALASGVSGLVLSGVGFSATQDTPAPLVSQGISFICFIVPALCYLVSSEIGYRTMAPFLREKAD